MCSQIICPSCRKPTWSGCGAHIEQALANVAWEARCKCRDPGRKPAMTPGHQQGGIRKLN